MALIELFKLEGGEKGLTPIELREEGREPLLDENLHFELKWFQSFQLVRDIELA
jgi:hypothetical protein